MYKNLSTKERLQSFQLDTELSKRPIETDRVRNPIFCKEDLCTCARPKLVLGVGIFFGFGKKAKDDLSSVTSVLIQAFTPCSHDLSTVQCP